MPEFELLNTAGDISGKLRLIYGSGPTDPAPFVLTLTPQYVARGTRNATPHVKVVAGRKSAALSRADGAGGNRAGRSRSLTFIANRLIHEMVTVERLPIGVKDKGQSKREEKPRNR
jgi:hypothetical protein